MASRKVRERRASSRPQLVAVPPAPSAPSPPGLPALPLTSFRGRRDLLDAVDAAFAAGARVVTLRGPVGIGKSRLALHWCAERSMTEGGTWYCDLADARRLADALGRVAGGLDLRPGALPDDERLADAVGAALRRLGNAVVLLDGLEDPDVLPAATLADWLAGAPEARVLITSRRSVGVAGELLLDVPPLSDDEAVGLFVDRARLVRRDFALSPAARQTLERIVHRLDRLPLAIELLAARALVLSPTEMLERLDRPVDLLAGDPLSRALSLSWELLAPPERECLQQCLIFDGGFSLDAAEQIVRLGGDGRTPPVLEVVERLVDRSWLRVLSAGTAERTRFGLYEAIRAFVARRTEPSSRALAERYERTFLERGEAWLAGANGPEASSCRARRLEDQANLLALHRRSRGVAPATVVRTAAILGPVLSSHGPPSTHLEVLDAAVQAAAAVDERARAGALVRRGWVSLHAGRTAAAEADLREALAVARRDADAPVEADALARLGHLCLRLERVTEAREHVEAALAVCRRANLDALEGQVLDRLGLLRLWEGALEEADAVFGQALRRHVEHQDHLWMGFSLCHRGAIRMELGRTSLARADFEQALREQEQVGDRRLQGVVWVDLGLIHHEDGDRSGARDLLERGFAILQQVGHRKGEAEAAEALGAVLLDQGDVGAARERFAAARDLYGSMGHTIGAARVDAYLAASEARSGRLRDAEACLQAARRVLGETPEGRKELPLVDALETIILARAVTEPASPERARSATEELRSRTLQADSAEGPIALRIARRLAIATLRDAGLGSGFGEGVTPHVVFGPECRWFQCAGAKKVTLGRRGAMRLVLEKLLALRFEQPGQGIDVYALFDAGWPGQRIRPDVGAARVYESIRVLRRLGLEGVLLHQDGGYLLDPNARLERAP